MRKPSLILLVIILNHGFVKCFEFTSYFEEMVKNVKCKFNNMYSRVMSGVAAFLTRPVSSTQSPIRRIGSEKTLLVHDQALNTVKKSGEKFEPMTMPQMAMMQGWKVKAYTVKTDDGYFLTLHRIAGKVDGPQGEPPKKSVLLHHGLLGSSSDWILLGPEKSLPYILYNAQYDVWLSNARGNLYSRAHKKYISASPHFWNFTFHEIGLYDIPAALECIRSKKKSKDPIYYVGHSLGATALLALLSTRPIYNDYIKEAVFLAPLAFMNHTKGLMSVLTLLVSDPSLKMLQEGEFLPDKKIPKWIASAYCTGPKLYCSNPVLFMSGGIRYKNMKDAALINRILSNVPSGGSSRTILHYAQLIESGGFHKFAEVQDAYPLKLITVPIVLICSRADTLSNPTDAYNLYQSFKSPVEIFMIESDNMTHTELVWGQNADVVVFNKVLHYLDNAINFNLTAKNFIM